MKWYVPILAFVFSFAGSWLGGWCFDNRRRRMNLRWMNEGRPDAKGVYCAVIVNSNGKEISRFEGRSPQEIKRLLQESQLSAERGKP